MSEYSNPHPFVPPTNFKLGSRTWRVKLVNSRRKWLGIADGHRCKIKLNTRRIRNNEELHHTFMHEMAHAIEFTLGWKLSEKKIDALGNMLAQIEQTARYHG